MTLILELILSFILCALMIYVSRYFHETSHYIFLEKFGTKPKKPKFNFFSYKKGGRVDGYDQGIFNSLSKFKKFIVYLSGPFVDLLILVFGLTIFFSYFNSILFLIGIVGFFGVTIIYGDSKDIKDFFRVLKL